MFSVNADCRLLFNDIFGHSSRSHQIQVHLVVMNYSSWLISFLYVAHTLQSVAGGSASFPNVQSNCQRGGQVPGYISPIMFCTTILTVACPFLVHLRLFKWWWRYARVILDSRSDEEILGSSRHLKRIADVQFPFSRHSLYSMQTSSSLRRLSVSICHTSAYKSSVFLSLMPIYNKHHRKFWSSGIQSGLVAIIDYSWSWRSVVRGRN